MKKQPLSVEVSGGLSRGTEKKKTGADGHFDSLFFSTSILLHPLIAFPPFSYPFFCPPAIFFLLPHFSDNQPFSHTLTSLPNSSQRHSTPASGTHVDPVTLLPLAPPFLKSSLY
jgi:hypothetical protein